MILFQIAEEFDEEVEVRPQVIHVNLDSQLPLILREIHYLSQAPFDILLPSSAKEILRNTDSFELRVTATRLETIVSKYNTIMRTITEFEKPLFERKLLKIDLVSLSINTQCFPLAICFLLTDINIISVYYAGPNLRF